MHERVESVHLPEVRLQGDVEELDMQKISIEFDMLLDSSD